MKNRGVLFALFGISLSCSVAFGASKAIMADHVPGELIVKVKAGQLDKFWADKSLNGIAVNREIDVSFGKFFVVKVGEDKSIESTISQLEASPYIEYAEPNFVYTIVDSKKNILETITSEYNRQDKNSTDFPVNDPMFGQLWGLQNRGNNDPSNENPGIAGADVGAVDAWANYLSGSRDVKIAIIDTGVDYNHPDLKNNIWVNQAEANGRPNFDDDGNGFIDDIHGYDFANNDGDPIDGNSHGTHCAGTIAAEHNNNIGVAGVMSEATIVAVKFLADNGSGSTESAIKAVDYATRLNVDLMSNSWGGGGASQALQEAIERARDQGILFVAAAGNSSSNNDVSPHYPSNYPVSNIISVAAHNYQDSLASFSCYGRNSVHISAPGRNILSTIKGGQYAVYSGTSMATPHVSGVVGLLLANEGRIPLEEIKERVMMTSIPVAAYRSTTISGGRINAYNLLRDERPDRNMPNPNAWQRRDLDDIFESQHPYRIDQNVKREINIPGAKYMRVIIAKYDLEQGYDFVKIIDGNGVIIENISGAGENYLSDYVEGENLTINFTSDRSFNKWGFKIEAIEFQ